MKFLLVHDADAGIADHSNHATPLHYAAERGNYLMLVALIDDNKVHLDINMKDAEGDTVLHKICFDDGIHTPEEFSDSDSAGNALKCLIFLLHHGAVANASNSRLITPLHYICGNDYLLGLGVGEPMVELLLEFDAHPNSQDAEGCTAVIIACMHREFNICILLMQQGADMNIPCAMDCYLLSKGYNRDSVNGLQELAKECTMSDLLPKPPRYRVFSAISAIQTSIPDDSRDRCMNCGSAFTSSFFSGFFTGKHHCRHCNRLLCKECCYGELPRHLFPEFVCEAYPSADPIKVCVICEKIVVELASQNGLDMGGVMMEEEDTIRHSSYESFKQK